MPPVHLFQQLGEDKRKLALQTLRAWVEGELKKRDWSLSDLAKKANLHPGTISNILTKTRKPGPDVCLAIADALNLPEETVFRYAGLLRHKPEADSEAEEMLHLFQQLGEDKRKLALIMLRAWVERG